MLGGYAISGEPFGAGPEIVLTDVRVSQGAVTSVTAGPAGGIRVSQTSVIVTYNIPAEEIKSSQAAAAVVYSANNFLRTSQASVMAVVRGAIDNTKLRAWTYTLDGHDFYVLKLGTSGKTLIYDLSTGQWSQWTSTDRANWRASLGMNWRSAGTIPRNYGSNVVVGDDSYGVLWVLDPEQATDDALLTEDPVQFDRIAMGQIPMRGRGRTPVFSTYLTASTGEPAAAGNSVTLEYSDDQGRSFVLASEPIIVETGNYLQEYVWRSLGLIQAPGRLFKITDNGAFARIDSMDVNE